MAVRRRVYESGAICWQVDVSLAGRKRYQRSFDSKSEAESDLARVLGERRLYGEKALAMTHSERLRYAEAAVKLEQRGLTLERAIEWALERAKVRQPITLEALLPAFVENRSRNACRPRYVQQLRVSIGGFVAGRELILANDVSREDVKTWLHGNGWQPVTQRNYLGDVRAMFNWAKEEGYCAANPCDGLTIDVDSMKDEEEITAFAPEHVEKLFSTALNHVGERFDRKTQTSEPAHMFRPLLGYVTLATFCGVRPEEIKRSPVTEIDFSHRAMIVGGSRAKTRQRRVVDLPANAVAWLRLWRRLCPGQEMIVPKNFRTLWERLRETAGLKPARESSKKTTNSTLPKWPHDVLRHTCATMHFATHQNTALLQAQLGHSEDENTLFRHYRAVKLLDGRVVTKKIAAKFWNIRPPARCE
jgi:integrase